MQDVKRRSRKAVALARRQAAAANSLTDTTREDHRMTTTAPTSADDAPDIGDLVVAGDAALLAERYEDATAHYRAALAAGADEASVAPKLERADATAASAVSQGEQQTRVYRDRFSAVASGSTLASAPDLPPPAATPTGDHGRGYAARVAAGRAAGTVGLRRLPPPHQAGRTPRRERRGLDRLVLRRRPPPRSAAEVVPDPQARPHARDPLREQPGPALPRGREDRVRRRRPRAARVGAAVAQRRRVVELPAARTTTAATTRWSGRRTRASSATSATTVASPASACPRTRRPTPSACAS